ESGPASRSYGVQVARLAGMPAPLLRQARATLESLEAERVARQPQSDLFAPAQPPAAEARPGVTDGAFEAAWQALDPDMLTPREALDALYRLKALRTEFS
ncbi:MAG TPA: DNA mismatch repair protein MutS, partial [Caldimonas sp.]|nr:DNA mismatch repair protein MutS [Caldimonas sp.]